MNDDGDYMHEAVIRGIGIGDGGQAFPIPDNERYGQTWGMSLRDYFAAQAMKSLIRKFDSAIAVYAPADEEFPAEIACIQRSVAICAYRYADAMLAERAAAAERGAGQ
jgi:hypothetical protein